MAYYVLVSDADIPVSHIITHTCSDCKYTTLAINFKAFLPLPLIETFLLHCWDSRWLCVKTQ